VKGKRGKGRRKGRNDVRYWDIDILLRRKVVLMMLVMG